MREKGRLDVRGRLHRAIRKVNLLRVDVRRQVIKMLPLVGFRSRKAAQVAASFACRSPNRHIEKLKLIKLLYLCERTSIDLRGRPMFYDEYYSLKDGPICSSALDAINGRINYLDERGWVGRMTQDYLRKDRIKNVYSVIMFAPEDLDEISEWDERIIIDIWKQFSELSSSQIRQSTHENCREYKQLDKGRLPIHLEDISIALGHRDSSELTSAVKEHRS